MFKLQYKHKDLEDLSWNVNEFNKLLHSNEIKDPMDYKLVLNVFNLFTVSLLYWVELGA